jgi:diguanylate cyclase (GGDEF)-like protein
MSAFEASAARTALPLYILSWVGLAACLCAVMLPTVSEMPPNAYLPVAIPVAAAALLANAASIAALFGACSAAALSLRASAGIRDEAGGGNGLQQLVEAVRQVDAALVETQRETERLNHADPLTGLGNRRWLQIVASRAFADSEAAGTPLSVLMLRVDHLQHINVVYGHDVGDRALMSCTDMLRRLVRRHDKVARISGNEFLVLMPNTQLDTAAAAGHRIEETLANVPQPLLGDAPLATRLAVVAWQGEMMLEQLLARAQGKLDDMPVADAVAPRAGAMLGDVVAKQDLALIGVRPSGEPSAQIKRRRNGGAGGGRQAAGLSPRA